jgi:hypothetical protein
MPLDPQLRAQLRQTIYVATATGSTSYGEQTFGAPVAALARVEPKDEETESDTGREDQSRWLIITEATITELDRIWLPGANQTDATQARRPRKVYKAIGEFGEFWHYEIEV